MHGDDVRFGTRRDQAPRAPEPDRAEAPEPDRAEAPEPDRAEAPGPGAAEAAALHALARTESARGRHEAAIAAARRAVLLDDSWAAHQALLEVLLAAGRPAEAVVHGYDVIAGRRHAHRVNILHARALAATGDRSGAATFYRLALDLDPDDVTALLGLAALQARRSPYEALRSVVAASPVAAVGSPAGAVASPATGAVASPAPGAVGSAVNRSAALAAGAAIGRWFAVRLALVVAGLVLVVVPLLGVGRGTPLPSVAVRTFGGAMVVGLLAGCWIPVRLLPRELRRPVRTGVVAAVVATSPATVALLVVAFAPEAAAAPAADVLRVVFWAEVVLLVPVGLLVASWGVLVLLWRHAEGAPRSDRRPDVRPDVASVDVRQLDVTSGEPDAVSTRDEPGSPRT